MNDKMITKLRSEHQKQALRIKRGREFRRINLEVTAEYEVARELLKARTQAELTQSDIAMRMGTTQSVVSRIERGVNVSIETIERYAEACGKHVKLRLVS